MKYRADIDGLRALAIIPVVLFHAGYDLFSGGFVGVDVFFVISGYLITAILIKDMKKGEFSLSSFYERRARRILPAYLFMMIVVLICGYHLFLSSEFKSLAESMLASLGFVSNIYFWQESGYFSIQSEYSPFLHTWSLSVEEQFYIFFPIGLLILHKYFSERIIFTLIILTLGLSFIVSIIAMKLSISAVFYLLPSRAWELLMGSILAIGIIPIIKNKIAIEVISFTGFCMIISAVFLYSKNTLFPGTAALLPVLGTVFIIYSGQEGRITYIGRLLSTKPFVFVGGISYSLYLWHWPIFVFMKNIYGEVLPNHLLVLAVILSFLAAWFSLNIIERPFLRKMFLPQKKSILIASSLSLIGAMAFCFHLISNNGYPQRFEKNVLIAESALNDYSSRRLDCHIQKGDSISYENKCVFGSDAQPSYAFWGDSHSVELSDSLGQYAKTIGVSGLHISYSSCPPSQGFKWLSRPLCGVHNAKILKGLRNDEGIKTVFLIARYNSYVRDEEMTKKMLDGLEQTIVGLKSSGKKVVIIYPIPRSNGVTPLDVARLIHRDLNVNNYSLPIEEYNLQNKGIITRLDEVVKNNLVNAIYPAEVLCRDNISCKFYINGKITHFDDDHLSLSGAKLFNSILIQHLAETKKMAVTDYE